VNKRDNPEHGGAPVVRENAEASLAEQRITRARAIKIAGAMVGTGAFALFLPDEADAANRRRRRRRLRRRRARQRRQAAVNSDQPGGTLNFGDVVVNPNLPLPLQTVTIENNGGTPVTIDPRVVGDGFSLGDLSGLNLTLQPGDTVDIPVVVDALTDGVKTGELRILDDSDGLLLETVDLVATVDAVL
jgi:hypothetical protein